MGVGKRIRISFFVPRNSDTVRVGTSATPAEVDRGVVSAGAAFAKWACRPTEERIRFAERFAEEIRKREDQLGRLISRKMGKSVWEFRTEVAGVVGKVNLSRGSRMLLRSRGAAMVISLRAASCSPFWGGIRTTRVAFAFVWSDSAPVGRYCRWCLGTSS